jgi:hypothetical protein
LHASTNPIPKRNTGCTAAHESKFPSDDSSRGNSSLEKVIRTPDAILLDQPERIQAGEQSALAREELDVRSPAKGMMTGSSELSAAEPV